MLAIGATVASHSRQCWPFQMAFLTFFSGALSSSRRLLARELLQLPALQRLQNQSQRCPRKRRRTRRRHSSWRGSHWAKRNREPPVGAVLSGTPPFSASPNGDLLRVKSSQGLLFSEARKPYHREQWGGPANDLGNACRRRLAAPLSMARILNQGRCAHQSLLSNLPPLVRRRRPPSFPPATGADSPKRAPSVHRIVCLCCFLSARVFAKPLQQGSTLKSPNTI